jgi:hypothetical protein
MTITFQPGHHPDADQLSAFIEQALPAHERSSILAHLAVCADCRAVVALAMPEEPAAQPASEPRRSSIFSGWMVFLPAAAAVAALSAFIFFVHRQGPALQQQAQISSAAPPVVQPAPHASIGSAPATRVVPAEKAPSPRPLQGMQVENGVVGANSSAAPPAGQAGQLPTPPPAAPSAFNSFASSGSAQAADQIQSAPQAVAQQGEIHGGAVGGIDSSYKVQPPAAKVQLGQQQGVFQQTASQTVQVQSEAPARVATETAEMSTLIASRPGSTLSFKEQPLPSGLPLLSSAAQGPIVLAIDTHHTVFVSNDSGQHWKTVRAVWKGRAVLVEASAPVKSLSLPVNGRNITSFAALPQGAMAAKPAGAILTGTVTDQSGAVVSGATVTVTDPRTHLARSIITDANGRYIASGLDPGDYDLDATATGFMSNHLSKVAVAASKENVANLSLRVGAATESVTVEASQASVELKAAPKVKAAPKENAKPVSAPLFEIITDKGVHWASADGLTWQPK